MACRLGINTHLHNLRHYSATELIAAGVDVRTVAGRLGHGGGGTTTLRVYAAWVAEADQRAAAGLLTRLPERPAPLPDPVERAQTDPRSPYERIAAELRAKILNGTLPTGEPLPTGKELAKTYGVSPPTAHRALTLLREWALVEVSRGHRGIVRGIVEPAASNGAQSFEQRILGETTATAGDAAVPDPPASVDQASHDHRETVMAAPQLWAITLRGSDGRRYPARHVREDIDQPDSFWAHLLAIARIEDPLSTDGGDNWIGDYELEVRDPDEPGKEPERVLRWQKG